MLNFLSLFLCLFFMHGLKARDEQNRLSNLNEEHVSKISALEKKRPLKYEDFEHLYPGCPENSLCTEKMGQKRKLFLYLLKGNHIKKWKEFILKEGVPVTYLSTQEQINQTSQTDRYVFTPSCKRLRENNRLLVTEFRKKASTDLRAAFNEEYGQIFIPREASPSFVKDNTLYLLHEFDDVYVYYTIDLKNNSLSMKLADPQIIKKYPPAQKCEDKNRQCYLVYNENINKTQEWRLPDLCPL